MKSTFLAIIIDGYNFLKTTGMMAENVEGIELEKGRKRLLAFLADRFQKPDPQQTKQANKASIAKQSIPNITVVFDSQTKLNLPKNLTYKGICVLFSKGYENADELIIELIHSNDVPKRLLVVSSDHEIQTAAKRRRATPIDSDLWLDELEAAAHTTEPADTANFHQSKPTAIASDTEYWLSVFKSDALDQLDVVLDQNVEFNKDQTAPKDGDSKGNFDSANESGTVALPDENTKPEQLELDEEVLEKFNADKIDIDDLNDIFPPGYGEDLLD